MPKMDGITLLEKCRHIPELQSISAFVLTTSDAEKDVEKAFELNVAGYILKLVNITDFIAATAKLKV